MEIVGNSNIVGNGNINFVTPLSKVVLTLYLAWCLFRILQIVENGDIVGSGDNNFVTPLSSVVLTLYLAWCLFRILQIVENGDIVGNGDRNNSVTPLSLVVLTLYLVWCLFRTIRIGHIPRCYGNLVTIATKVLCKYLFCLNVLLRSYLVRSFLSMIGINTYLIAMVTRLPWQQQ